MADLQTWAYRAAGGGEMMGGYRQQEHDALMKTIDELSKLGDSGDNHSAKAQKVIDQNGALPPSEYKALLDQYMNQDKQEYVDGNNQQQQKKLMDISKQGEQYNEWVNFRNKFAEDHQDGKFSNAFLESDKGKFLLNQAMSDEQVLKQMKCPPGVECADENNMGIYLPDYKVVDTARNEIDRMTETRDRWASHERGTLIGNKYNNPDMLNLAQSEINKNQNVIDSNPQIWTGLSTLNDEYDSWKIDEKAQGVIFSAGQTFKNAAFNSVPEDNIQFDVDSARQVAQDTIIGPHSMDSLIYDPMIGKRILYQDLQDHIMGKEKEGGRTYADFIPPNMLMEWDIDGDGEIDGNEAKTVADALLADKNKDKFGKTLKDKYVENYYVSYLENQHNHGLNTSRKKKDDDDEDNDDDTEKTGKIIEATDGSKVYK